MSLCFRSVRVISAVATRLRQFAWVSRHRWRSRRNLGPKLLRAFADSYPAATFIEIGANDGRQHDHLGRLIAGGQWRGLMVEPNPGAFARLRQAYGDNERVILVNTAIADRDGRIPFYEIAAPINEHDWELVGSYDALGSLSKEALLSHGWIADVEQRIVETDVECMRFASLCEKHAIEQLDLLVVDTEGYDFEVLRSADLERLRPRLLIYEHALLEDRDYAKCREMLERLGYGLIEEWLDTWCVDLRFDDVLAATWRELRPVAPALRLR